MFHVYILLVGACLPVVSASVYPTQPVQATVWSADQPMFVSWIEDWKYPTLSEMGPLDISLWSDTDTYLAPLASGVDPMAKMHQVTVPERALRQGSKYTLRFTTSKPIDVMVYSADFAIIPANTTMGSATGAGAASTGSPAVALATQSGANTGTGTGTGTGSGFKTAPTTTAGSSSTLTATTTTTAASSRFGSTTSSGVPPPSGTIPGGSIPAGQRAASAGRRGVDVEKLKFRFVFMIWPVLMGITMAL